MKCPKCGENVSKDDKICRNCGTVIKKEKKGFLSLFFGKKKKADPGVPLLETKAEGAIVNKFKYIKAAAAAGAVIIVILLIIILIFHVASGKGLKQAEKFAEYIGSKVTTAEQELEVHLKDNSAFSSVNKADSFDYIYESESRVTIEDVSFPEWTVTIMRTDSEKIDQVIFTDYRVLKKDVRGPKLDKRVDLDKFDKETKISSVLDEIDADPFRITYEDLYRKYEYRYYYKLDSGDAQGVILSVVCDYNNKYLYYVEEDIFPVSIVGGKLSARAQ
ncbi:MAG: zinc ribbon domain-containing protein [Ruminococcus sp.]|nr:zinc ribbon domain-containing protein [Ruminococcus sp.]